MSRIVRLAAFTFVIQCVGVASITACHEMTSPTRALSNSVQASADTLGIEVAVAEHYKAWVMGKNVTLDSRLGMSPRDAERPVARTQELARILGVPVAHGEDVLGCIRNRPDSGEHSVITIATPTIKGDTARIGVGIDSGVSGKSRCDVQVGYGVIVTRTNGVWTFTKIETVNVS